jgi:hypothetical protein
VAPGPGRALSDAERRSPPFLRGSEVFAGYTCLVCGHRSATWATFREHRAQSQNGHPCQPSGRVAPDWWVQRALALAEPPDEAGVRFPGVGERAWRRPPKS